MTTNERRVLAVMASVKDAERTTDLLARAGIVCVPCADLPSACAQIRDGAGAMIIGEDVLRRDTRGILRVTLQAAPSWSALPLVVLGRGDADAALDSLFEDAKMQVTLVERPVRTRTLLTVVKSALRARQHQYAIRDAIIEREEQASLLREREESLAFALASGRLGSWELDIATRTLTCSNLFKAAFGKAADEPFSYDDLLSSIHPEDIARVSAAISETINRRVDYDVEYRNVWPNGQIHWAMVRGRPDVDGAGPPKRLVGVSLDVTDKKEREEALKAQAELLREGARRKDEFLATLAHELRNPLAPVRTGLAILAHDPNAENTEKTRGVMERQLAHMVRLIDDLLDVSRITTGKVILRKEIVRLRDIVETAIEATRPLIDAAHHELSVVLPANDVYLEADATRLAQVIGNLLNNAAKYTPSGGRINLSARDEGQNVVIDVQDNGMGIPSSKLDEVFESSTRSIGR